MKKCLKIIFCIVFFTAVILYLGIVFLLPKTVNNKSVINGISSLIYNKTKIETNITGLNLKVSPKLKFTLNIENIDAKYVNTPILDVKNLSLKYKLLQNQLVNINAKDIYIDGNSLKKLAQKPNSKKKKEFELNKVPEINIQNLVYKSDEVCINAHDINTESGIIKLKISVDSPYLKEVVEIGNSGTLQIIEDKLVANQLKIKLKNSKLFMNGTLFDKDKNYDFKIIGEQLPVSELMAALLYLQKSMEPSKKFIENFKDFTGSVNIDLKIDKNGIWGKSVTNNFGAKTVLYDIPLSAKEVVFNFKGNQMESVSEAKIGTEKSVNKVKVTGLGTENMEVNGSSDTILTNAFKNVPNLTIKNYVKTNVTYKIKSNKIDVFYNTELNPGSDFIYSTPYSGTSYLGLRNYKRKISAHTLKDGQNLFLKDFKYSYYSNNKENEVISADGLLLRISNEYIPQYVNCRTNGYAPVSVTGSFGEKLAGGEFSGNLKYNFVKDKITGTFNVRNAKYKAFEVEKAHIDAKNDILNITVNGLFKGEKYSAEMSVKNDFADDILVYNMKMFLDKLLIETNSNEQSKPIKIRPEELTQKVNEAGITINNWEVLINEIKRDKFVINKVKLIGSLKNNIFNFNMDKLNFADGTISAKGIYDFVNNTSKMTFEAKDIDSNKAAYMMLNLDNQIEGIANAKVELDAKEMFKFIDVHSVFEIKEGFLPKLGDVELAMENSKYKLSDIVNIDLAQKDLMKDDIKGTFDVHNTELKNINITTWHELSAMFLEGSYEMEKQYADLQVFWKYSKEAPKGVKIFYVPLSLILKVVFRPEKTRDIYEQKLSKVPEINEDKDNTSYYRIKLNGDINNNKIDLIFKEIK